MHDSGDYPIAEIAAIFKVSRPTIYRAPQRTAPGGANLPADTCSGLASLDKYDLWGSRTRPPVLTSASMRPSRTR
jgi:Helix-turn-helix domain of resolvase